MGDVIYLDPANKIKTDMINFLSNLINRVENDEMLFLALSFLDKDGDIGYYHRGTFNAPIDGIKLSGLLEWQQKLIIGALENIFQEFDDNGKNSTEKKGED
jgi:hypothetical protein